MQVENLQNLSDSQSTILSSSAVSLLEALSLLTDLGDTPIHLLGQLKKVCPVKTSAYRNIVKNLSDFVGKLYNPINKSIEAVGQSITHCLEQFESRYEQRKDDRCEKIDFKALLEGTRLNTKTVAFIASTALNKTTALQFADDTYEALTITSLISCLLLLSVHGVNVNMATVLLTETCNLSPFLYASFATLDPIVRKITDLIGTAVFDSVPNIRKYLHGFVDITYSYDSSFERLLGPFGGVNISVAEVKDNLKKSRGPSIISSIGKLFNF